MEAGKLAAAYAELCTTLETPLGGLSIPTAVAKAMAQDAVEALGIEDSEAFKAMGSEMIVGLAEDLEPTPKGVTLLLVRKWSQFFCGEETPPAKKAPTATTKEKKKTTPKVGFSSAVSESDDDDGWDVASTKRAWSTRIQSWASCRPRTPRQPVCRLPRTLPSLLPCMRGSCSRRGPSNWMA